MATYTKTGSATIGRGGPFVYTKTGGGVAGDYVTLVHSASGTGSVNLSGSARDQAIFSKSGQGVLTRRVFGVRSGGTSTPLSFSVGPAVVTSTTAITSTTIVTGQGNFPLARCRLSYDDVSVPTPSWGEVANADFRSFSSSRGRDNELSEFDAGTASVTFDNRDRSFDPLNNSAIRPLNRVWLYYEFNGRVRDIFKGYASSWGQDWPNGGWSDAVATANASDELLVLSQAALPTTNPPRESYDDLIASDSPIGYWDMSEDPAGRTRVSSSDDSWQFVPPEDPVIERRGDLRRAQRGSRRKH